MLACHWSDFRPAKLARVAARRITCVTSAPFITPRNAFASMIRRIRVLQTCSDIVKHAGLGWPSYPGWQAAGAHCQVPPAACSCSTRCSSSSSSTRNASRSTDSSSSSFSLWSQQWRAYGTRPIATRVPQFCASLNNLKPAVGSVKQVRNQQHRT
jgi:hypothetical protein